MKHLVGKAQTKKVKFLGDTVEIRKLTVSQVMELQEIIKNADKEDPMAVLRDTLRLAVIGAEEMTNEEFDTFPPADLNELSEEVLKYCGLMSGQSAGN